VRISANSCQFPIVWISKYSVGKSEVDTDLCEAKECRSNHENCLGDCHVCDANPSC
jgi:hypothetical protein